MIIFFLFLCTLLNYLYIYFCRLKNISSWQKSLLNLHFKHFPIILNWYRNFVPHEKLFTNVWKCKKNKWYQSNTQTIFHFISIHRPSFLFNRSFSSGVNQRIVLFSLRSDRLWIFFFFFFRHSALGRAHLSDLNKTHKHGKAMRPIDLKWRCVQYNADARVKPKCEFACSPSSHSATAG